MGKARRRAPPPLGIGANGSGIAKSAADLRYAIAARETVDGAEDMLAVTAADIFASSIEVSWFKEIADAIPHC